MDYTEIEVPKIVTPEKLVQGYGLLISRVGIDEELWRRPFVLLEFDRQAGVDGLPFLARSKIGHEEIQKVKGISPLLAGSKYKFDPIDISETSFLAGNAPISFDGEQSQTDETALIREVITKDYRVLAVQQALVLDQIAAEIRYLYSTMPNEPEQLDIFKGQIEFLEKITVVIKEMNFEISNAKDLDKTSALIQELRAGISKWYEKHKVEVFDTAIRVPAMASAIGLLAFAGASMTPATIAVGALIGGPKVLDMLKPKLVES